MWVIGAGGAKKRVQEKFPQPPQEARRCGHKSSLLCDTPLFWGLIYTWLCSHGRQLPRSRGLCSLALTHVPTWPDLLVDEAPSLCSGMWGNQSLGGLA